MKDYVAVTKPSQIQFWWKRYGEAVQFGVFVLAIAIIGGVV